MNASLSLLQKLLALAAAGSGLAILAVPFATIGGVAVPAWGFAPVTGFAVATVALAAVLLARGITPAWFWALALTGAIIELATLDRIDAAASGYWLTLSAAWLDAWLFAELMTAAIRDHRLSGRAFGFMVPLTFGIAILVLWEVATRAAHVPTVLLPPPSAIWARITSSLNILGADFVQTFVKSVLTGYVLGCGAGFLVAVAIDRSPFLKQGLLPLGSFVSALPMVGVAPIMVMWFGFDWPSKAAVVVIMTFFPMLVNTVAGLSAAGSMERDMMRTYAAGYWQTLVKLRLPAAMPFIFNALKINSTLALIGAIVAEFFGTPVVGMGFRISTEVGKLNVDMVWAEIAVAALAGSVFYGIVALVERSVTFWHPSVRGG